MRSTTRPAWLSEAEALAYIASVVGDVLRARAEYLKAPQEGELGVRGRRTLMALIRELIPREEWFRAEWLESTLDPLINGFHFLPLGRGDSWVDREVRRDELEALWPQLDSRAAQARRQAAVAAVVARGVRFENTSGGWKAIGKIVRAAAPVPDEAPGFSNKAIERDFKKELQRPSKKTRPE
jgi:hypothetical protein